MARAIWTGELLFGKVRIPIRLEGAVEDKSVKSRLLHRKDKGRLQQKRVCRKCGREISWEDTARAVEVGNREVVDFEADELKALKVERENDIVLAGFADASSVDPVYYNRTYVLVPAGKQPRAFELFASLLRESGKIAVTRANLSGRSYPAIVRPRGADLVLHTLHYGDEVRDARERGNPKLRPSARELDLAKQLVDHMSMPFDPGTTEDPYRVAVGEIAAGRKPRPIDEAAARRKALEKNADVVDLMSALQRSLKQTPNRGAQATRKAARTSAVRGKLAKTKPAARETVKRRRAAG